MVLLKIPQSTPLKEGICTTHPVPAARCPTQAFRDRTREANFSVTRALVIQILCR